MMDIAVLRPWALLFLFPAVLFCFFRLKSVQAWLGIVDAHLIDALLVKTAARLKERLSGLFLVLCVVSVLGALSGVSVKDGRSALYHPKSPAVIMLDMSLSMKVKDVSPNRFSRAIFKIYDLLEELKGIPVAFIVFTDEPYLLLPPTTDKSVIEAVLPLLNFSLMPSQGTRTDRAIEEALRTIKETGASFGDLFLITDGGEEVWEVQEKTESLVREAALNKNRLFVLGTGTPEGGLLYERDDKPVLNALGDPVNHPLKEGFLKRWASLGGGKYVRAQTDNSDIAALMKAKADLSAGEKSSVEDPSLQDTGFLFLILPLIGFPFLFLKGRLLAAVWIVLSFSFPVRADVLDSFLSPSAAAMRKLEKNAPEEAVSLALTSNEFIALYNVGTKLIALQNYPQAIVLLEKAVLIRPDDENAQINLEIARRLNENQTDNDSPDQNGNQGSDQGDGDEKQEDSPNGNSLNQNNNNDLQDNENKENSDNEKTSGEEGGNWEGGDGNDGESSSGGEGGNGEGGDGNDGESSSGGENGNGEGGDDEKNAEGSGGNRDGLIPVHEDPLTLLRHKILFLYREKRYNREKQIGVQW